MHAVYIRNLEVSNLGHFRNPWPGLRGSIRGYMDDLGVGRGSSPDGLESNVVAMYPSR